MDASSSPANSGEEFASRQDVTPAGKRLFWTLNGPLEHAIQVAPSEYYEPGAVMEPYCRPSSTASSEHDVAPSWHAVSQESLMEPKATSLTVRIRCIDEWEMAWNDQHWRCYDDYDAHDGDRHRYPRRLGPHPDDETFDPHLYISECCGQKRPWAKETQLEVTTGGAFLTVHEYVSAVHTWLMTMRETLLDVLGKYEGNPPWPAETKLAVVTLRPGPLRIDDETKWAWWHRKPPVMRGPIRTVGDGSGDERSRRAKERILAWAAARVRERKEVEARTREMEKLDVN